jgi:hypothetical protein
MDLSGEFSIIYYPVERKKIVTLVALVSIPESPPSEKSVEENRMKDTRSSKVDSWAYRSETA